MKSENESRLQEERMKVTLELEEELAAYEAELRREKVTDLERKLKAEREREMAEMQRENDLALMKLEQGFEEELESFKTWNPQSAAY